MASTAKRAPLVEVLLVLVRSTDSAMLFVPTHESTKQPFHYEFPPNLFTDFVSIEVENSESFESRSTMVTEFVSRLVLQPPHEIHSSMLQAVDLGVYNSPKWGCNIDHIKYYMKLTLELNAATEVDGGVWMTAAEALRKYNSHELLLTPPSLGLIRSINSDSLNGTEFAAFHDTVEKSPRSSHKEHSRSPRASPRQADSSDQPHHLHPHHRDHSQFGAALTRYFHALAQDATNGMPGVHSRSEFSPGVECIPIVSNTLYPFHATNLVTVSDGGEVLIVDPGANEKGKSHLEAVLARLAPEKFLVFLTHHHHDHVEALDVIEHLYPQATVIGHPYTLHRLKSSLKLVQQEVCSNDSDESLTVGSRTLQIISLPGHTRGHLALFEPIHGTLVAGDHVVGFGSSVLDPDGGGEMSAYLKSTHRLLELDIHMMLPCHGAPLLTSPKSVLETYIKHRLERESFILKAWMSGIHNVDDITKQVYTDTPERLLVASKRNVLLHLEKLHNEKKVELHEAVLCDIRSHREV